VTGTVGSTCRSTRPSRSKLRTVWVSIFWLAPAIRRDSCEYRNGPSWSCRPQHEEDPLVGEPVENLSAGAGGEVGLVGLPLCRSALRPAGP
jgi:hypothetical protein